MENIMLTKNLSSEFLTFGKKVKETSVPQEVKDIFKSVCRIKEQWYLNGGETYQVQFIIDNNDSWFAVRLDEKDNFYIYEGALVTSTGIHWININCIELTGQQILQVLSLPTAEEMYNKILSFGPLTQIKRQRK